MTFKYSRRYKRKPITLIEEIRVKLFRMSQTEFGKILNRGQSTIQRWEHTNPDMRTLPQSSDLVKLKSVAEELNVRVRDKQIFEIAEGKLAG